MSNADMVQALINRMAKINHADAIVNVAAQDSLMHDHLVAMRRASRPCSGRAGGGRAAPHPQRRRSSQVLGAPERFFTRNHDSLLRVENCRT